MNGCKAKNILKKRAFAVYSNATTKLLWDNAAIISDGENAFIVKTGFNWIFYCIWRGGIVFLSNNKFGFMIPNENNGCYIGKAYKAITKWVCKLF